jgi:hypothetical protein
VIFQPNRRHTIIPLILGILMMAIFILFVGGLFSLRRSGEEAKEIELQNFDHLRSIAAYEPQLTKVKSVEEEGAAYSSLFLGNGTPSELSAQLLTTLNQMAAERNVQILRTHDLPPRQRGPIMLVGGEIEMSGAASALYAILLELEVTKPILVVDRLAIRSNAGGSDEELGDMPVSVELRVLGAMRSPAGTLPEADAQ